MDVMLEAFQRMQLLLGWVLFIPLMALGAFAVGAAVLLMLAELLMYGTYRVLTRIGFLD